MPRPHHRYRGKTTVSLPFPAPSESIVAWLRAVYRGFLDSAEPTDHREVEAEQAATAYIARLIAGIRVADHRQNDNLGWEPTMPECVFCGDELGRKPKPKRA